MTAPTYDYVVIGGGSSGCAVAARLSEDADITVLLLEAGPHDTSNPSVAIPSQLASLQRTNVDWDFRVSWRVHDCV